MKNPEKLLDLLSQDARLSTAQLAAMTGSSEDEVVSQLKHYEKNGTILGYKALVDWDKTDRESVYLMSGGFDLTVIIKDRTMREVARFVAEQLAPMENVLSTGTHFILKKYKDYGVEYDPSEKDKREVMMSW